MKTITADWQWWWFGCGVFVQLVFQRLIVIFMYACIFFCNILSHY